MVPSQSQCKEMSEACSEEDLSVLWHILLLPYKAAMNEIWWTVLHLQKIWPWLC